MMSGTGGVVATTAAVPSMGPIPDTKRSRYRADPIAPLKRFIIFDH